jgi:hypothetical protein
MRTVYPPFVWRAKIFIPVALMNRDLRPRGLDFRYVPTRLGDEAFG